MWEVFNMGCGMTVVVAQDAADAALALLSEHHPGAAVIGSATDRDGVVELPGLGIRGARGGKLVSVD
jgi:phosphoribosylformylglycinamidine cyclo-ligase